MPPCEALKLVTRTSVSVIATAELLYSAELIYAVNFRQIPLLLVVSIWYLAVTSVLSVIQYYIERHFGRGSSHDAPMTLPQRLMMNLRHVRPPQRRDEGGAAA